MNRLLITFMVGFAASTLFARSAVSQNSRVVAAAQANGIYRYVGNEFRVLALGHNMLKVQFDGTYHTIVNSVNLGSASGRATIEGNLAIFLPEDTQNCKISMTFFPGKLVVEQDGEISIAASATTSTRRESTARCVAASRSSDETRNVLAVL